MTPDAQNPTADEPEHEADEIESNEYENQALDSLEGSEPRIWEDSHILHAPLHGLVSAVVYALLAIAHAIKESGSTED